MVIMASGITRGHVRMTATMATTKLRNLVAMLQIIGWQRHAALVYRVPLWYWTSMLWSTDTCHDKVSADQYHMTTSQAQVYSSSRSRVFWSWLLTKCWVLIGSRTHVRLICWKQLGRIVWKPVNANSGLKVDQSITYSSIQMFFAALFYVYGDYWNSKQKAKQYTENLTAKLKNSNQNSTFSWVSLIELWTTWPRSYGFRLA